MSGRVTQKKCADQVDFVCELIRGAGKNAAVLGRGEFSYAAMAGSLSVVVKMLVRDLGGEPAVQKVEAALNAAMGGES